MNQPGTPVRDLAIGIGAAATALALFFFGTTGVIEVATMLVVLAGLIWFATVDSRRLVDEHHRPALMLFGLAGVGCMLLLTAVLALRTVIEMVNLSLGIAAVVVGLVRAIRRSWFVGHS
jgi:hypothetical protein